MLATFTVYYRGLVAVRLAVPLLDTSLDASIDSPMFANHVTRVVYVIGDLRAFPRF
jgi:hypothetical protein